MKYLLLLSVLMLVGCEKEIKDVRTKPTPTIEPASVET